MVHEFLVLELVERESVAALQVVVVVLDIGDDALAHLQLHVFGGIVALLVLIERLEILLDDRTLGDDVGTQIEREQRDECRGNHVGPHHAPETDTGCQYGDNLGIAGHLRGKEDDGDEHEERREQIREIGNEIQVVVEHDGLQGRMVFGELRKILVDIEHDGNRDDERNGEEIGGEELLDDVPVDGLDIAPGIESAKFVAYPSQHGCKPAELAAQPAEGTNHPRETPFERASQLIEPVPSPYLSVIHFLF